MGPRWRPEKFRWRWVIVAILLVVGGHVGAYRALGPELVRLLEADRILVAFALATGTALGIYFLGGLVVGRMSTGHTTREPAVASLISLILICGLQFRMGMINIVGLLVGAPFCFGASYLGAWVGEKWQHVATRR
ncbi:MAG: hypothetical protein IT371_18995 [Deltaproteobacteria bacterium]|nr:hypothetical protein [Deltaproteobacteria bacterium]